MPARAVPARTGLVASSGGRSDGADAVACRGPGVSGPGLPEPSVVKPSGVVLLNDFSSAGADMDSGSGSDKRSLNEIMGCGELVVG